jgi:hypothetical protein
MEGSSLLPLGYLSSKTLYGDLISKSMPGARAQFPRAAVTLVFHLLSREDGRERHTQIVEVVGIIGSGK